MKKNIIIAIFMLSFAFSDELVFESDSDNNEAQLYASPQTITDQNESSANERKNEENDNAAYTAKTKKKPEPVISFNNRQILISLENSKSMKITAFTVNGRKLLKKQFSGGSASFTVPKSAKNAIIVQIDSDGRFYSKKVALIK